MKMKRIIVCILAVLLYLPGFAANDIVRVEATYEYISDNARETPEQAEQTAIERAKYKALAEHFGTDVASVTNTLTTNKDEASQTNVLSLGSISVRGEWVETSEVKILEKTFVKGFWRVKVHVEGRARRHAAEKADVQYTVVKDPQDLESPVVFRDESPVYLRFMSPVAGHLCVYLVDEANNAFCLLPYPHQQEGCQAVEANKDYIFFSEEADDAALEYKLTSEKSSEQNILYVIFSPNDFTKAADRQGGKNFRNDPVPRSLSYEAFLKWVTRIQTKDPQLLVRKSVVTIRK